MVSAAQLASTAKAREMMPAAVTRTTSGNTQPSTGRSGAAIEPDRPLTLRTSYFGQPRPLKDSVLAL